MHRLLPLHYPFTSPAPPDIYTLSLHDALPIWCSWQHSSGCFLVSGGAVCSCGRRRSVARTHCPTAHRSEEHTSELQSRLHLVCRLLLEKKKKEYIIYHIPHDTHHTIHHVNALQ